MKKIAHRSLRQRTPWVVMSPRRVRRLQRLLAWLTAFGAATAAANPQGAQVVSGQAKFDLQGNTLTVTNTPGAIVNWQTFNIGRQELTRFVQESARSQVLNRVVGGTPSEILGALQSNGRVFLVNPNGVVFGREAQVDVAGLVVSTLHLSNEDFTQQRYRFQETSGAGAVQNLGRISTASGGQVLLIAPQVDNSGVIQAPDGHIWLAAGGSVEVADIDQPELRVEIRNDQQQAVNLGELMARQVSVYGGLVRHAGVIEARSASVGPGGVVRLHAGAAGTTEVNGRIDAQGRGAAAAAQGGSVRITGQQVRLGDAAHIDASGPSGGGEVLVGGGWQGADASVTNATHTTVASGAQMHADAWVQGDGGTVVVWADDTARVQGQLTARGGAQSGDGGRIETSGKRRLQVTQAADASAPHGQPGQWLLDPYNLTVQVDTGSLDANGPTFYADSDASTVSATVVNTALSAGTDVLITTGAGDGTDTTRGHITVAAPIQMAAASGTTSATLTLNAAGNIHLQADIGASQGVLDVDMVAGGAVSADPVLRQDGSSTPAWVQASRLFVQATQGVMLEGNNQVQNLMVQNLGTGAVALRNTGDLNVTSMTNPGGDVRINNTGHLTVAGLNTAGDVLQPAAGNVDLTATGDLNISNFNATAYVGASALPNMGGHVNLSGANLTLRGLRASGNVGLTASGNVNLLSLNEASYVDDTHFVYNLPFTFKYYGQSYTQAAITTNGLITFGATTDEYEDSVAGLTAFKAVAPAWNDWVIGTSYNKDIRINASADTLGVRWDVARFASESQTASFESVLRADGSIRFNYGAANYNFANDVTVGLSDGLGTVLPSALLQRPNFSLNLLPSTTFTPNATGGYTETVSDTATPLSTVGTVSGLALLGRGSGDALNTLGQLTVQVGGALEAPDRVVAAALDVTAHTGVRLTGDNAWGRMAVRNLGSSGAVEIYNTAPELVLDTLTNAALDAPVLLEHNGDVRVAGPVQGQGALGMAASGAMTVAAPAGATQPAQVRARTDLALTARTGTLAVQGDVVSDTGRVTLTAGAGLSLADNAHLTAATDATLYSAAGNITSAAALQVGALWLSAPAGNIAVHNAAPAVDMGGTAPAFAVLEAPAALTLGDVTAQGNIELTQTAGTLSQPAGRTLSSQSGNVGLTAQTLQLDGQVHGQMVALNATGAVLQADSGAVHAERLGVASGAGAALLGTGNQLAFFSAQDSGAGTGVQLVNTTPASATVFTLENITAQGDITVSNTGGMHLPEGYTVHSTAGNVALQTFSPLTVDGAVQADAGSVALTAGNGGALTLGSTATVVAGSGDVSLTGGSVANAATITDGKGQTLTPTVTVTGDTPTEPPTPEPTPEPTEPPTPAPTPEPTPEPTPAPTEPPPEPTQPPLPEPTEPPPEPTQSPVPEPTLPPLPEPTLPPVAVAVSGFQGQVESVLLTTVQAVVNVAHTPTALLAEAVHALPADPAAAEPTPETGAVPLSGALPGAASEPPAEEMMCR